MPNVRHGSILEIARVHLPCFQQSRTQACVRDCAQANQQRAASATTALSKKAATTATTTERKAKQIKHPSRPTNANEHDVGDPPQHSKRLENRVCKKSAVYREKCMSSEKPNASSAGRHANLSMGGGPHMRIRVSSPGAGMFADTICRTRLDEDERRTRQREQWARDEMRHSIYEVYFPTYLLPEAAAAVTRPREDRDQCTRWGRFVDANQKKVAPPFLERKVRIVQCCCFPI